MTEETPVSDILNRAEAHIKSAVELLVHAAGPEHGRIIAEQLVSEFCAIESARRETTPWLPGLVRH